MREEDLKILTSVGLSKNESIIYLDLFRNPNSGASDIASRTRFHRPNVYDSLRRLKERGLISEISKQGTTIFNASDPNKLKIYMDQIGEDLLKFISDLKKISKIGKEKQSVSISEGMVPIKAEIINFLKNKKTPIYVLGVHEDFINKDFAQKFHKERISKKIPMKVLLYSKKDRNLVRFKKMPYTEIKYLNYGGDINLTSVITGDMVYHISYKDQKPVMIKIVQEDIANEQKAHFDNAWKKAKKF